MTIWRQSFAADVLAASCFESICYARIQNKRNQTQEDFCFQNLYRENMHDARKNQESWPQYITICVEKKNPEQKSPLVKMTHFAVLELNKIIDKRDTNTK